MPTIFDSVVTKENDHTNLLRNLMDRDPQIAAIALSCLTGETITNVESSKLNFRTQQSFTGPDGREIPDIVVSGDNLQCVIEVKIDPQLGLTAKQREGYARCFSSTQKRNYLCFLVPIGWKHLGDVANVTGLLRQNSVRTTSTCWNVFISELAKQTEDGQGSELLREVVTFWKWRFEVCPMSPDERNFIHTWSGEKYSAFRKLEKTVEQLKKLFDARQSKTELETDVNAYGFYIKDETGYKLWVGIWDKAPAPFCYGYHVNDPQWFRPRTAPADSVVVMKYRLWTLPPETWDDPELAYAILKPITDGSVTK